MLDIPVKYALFDMDGTLTDTMSYWRYATDEFLQEEGLSLSEEQHELLHSKGIGQGIAYVRSLHLSSRADNYSIQDLLAILKWHYERDAVAKPCVSALLEELKARGVRMAVATLTPTPLAQICLERVSLLSYFDFILGGESYPEGKSKPRIFEDAAARFGCAPHEMLLFEDSLYSIKTALTLSIPVVGVADVFQTKERDEIMENCVAFFDDGFSVRVK